MAEGHSIVRWARMLEPIIGETLVAVQLPSRYRADEPALVGTSVRAIRTHGKHLLLDLSDGRTLHCHAMMFGSWQFARPCDPFRKPAERIRLRLVTGRHQAVFFSGPVVELLDPAALRRHRRLSALGPDLLHEPFNAEEALRRYRSERAGRLSVADALIDQTLLAGIGNIFKSEGLFLSATHPTVDVHALSDEELHAIWRKTRILMQRAARGSGPVCTLPRERRSAGSRERHYVYGRRGRRCFQCGEKIIMIRQGPNRRTTFFCPACQPLSRRQHATLLLV